MIHFIPAWYDARRPWYSTDSVWFGRAMGSGTDATVTQLRVFSQGTEEIGVMVLNYAPSLRRFLHSQGIFDVPYWSFFDEVQGLGDDYTRPIDFRALEWPEDVAFFYNPFLVTVMRGDEVYARVRLAREGTLQSIRFYGAGMPALERVYDDRGFLSSVLMHDEAGRPATQYYLSRDGDVIVSEDVPTGRIDVVQNPDRRFRQASYASWEEVMAEFLAAQLTARRARRGGERDTVVIAPAAQHDGLIAAIVEDEILVLSRSAATPADVSGALLDRAGAVFTDGSGAETGIDSPWALLPELSVYPLERRTTFGASANEATVYISLFVDGITPERLDYAIAVLAGHLVGEGDVRLLVCTFRADDLDHLKEIRRVIGGYQHLDRQLADDLAGLSVDIGIAEEPEERIQLAFLDREDQLIRTMAKSRVLIDLGATVHHRLATEAVNAGVPQINGREQSLVTHPINGYVIGDDAELAPAVDHFLSGLEHWNQSLVQCRVLQDLFRPQEVLGRWELVKEGVDHARPADRA